MKLDTSLNSPAAVSLVTGRYDLRSTRTEVITQFGPNVHSVGGRSFRPNHVRESFSGKNNIF